MTTDELINFIAENTSQVVARNWQADIARAEQAEAKLAVLGGEWCAENRAAGRGPCGACAWCCQQEHARADAAEAECERLREELAALTAELERLHVGLSNLQDGMPDYLDCAVQALIDNEPSEDGDA